jgi:hypothetical protein
MKIRPIALYLPQYHPIPENDEWWGKGFTEWRNVVRARPRFKGHYQPHLPSDLGFYDLRIPEVREAQVQLAREYGIYGFCYYHYWFNGKELLERPFREVIESGKPDFPFMLCWANENWTRVWDGGNNEVLIEQKYSEEDDIAHINYLIPFFRDRRYIKVNGRPVFIVYKDALFPDIDRTVQIFRNECAKHNIDIYLCKFDRVKDTLDLNNSGINFDAAIEFQPLSATYLEFISKISKIDNSLFSINKRYLYPKTYIKFILKKAGVSYRYLNSVRFNGDNIISYKEFIDYDLRKEFKESGIKLYPCVSPGFDNSSRRTGLSATIFQGSTPDLFKKWVKGKITKFQPYSEEENFIFINAWNEWAEGNHLEPCVKWGDAYLKAFQEGLGETKR